MRIKKVLLKIKGNRWEVLAEINPLFVIMSGPMPDEDLMSIIKKEKGDVPKGLKKGDEFIDDQGRKLMKISRLDEFTRTPDYREIFALANKRGISDDVIHHLIEKGSDFTYLFEKELINAPKSLRAIPKGNINEVLHLSDIRKAWDKVYGELNLALSRGAIDKVGIQEEILIFAKKTDTFIEKSLEAITKAEVQSVTALTKQEIQTITNNLKYLLK